MKQTIEIEVPEGKKAIWKDGKVVFEDIKKLPKTWEEFCKIHNKAYNEVWIDNSSKFIKVEDRHERKPDWDRNVLPSEQAARQHLALMQLHQLRDCYRQGWVPDWRSNENKFCIGNYHCSYIGTCYMATPYFLAFQSKEIAEEFLCNFRDLIEQAGDLI